MSPISIYIVEDELLISASLKSQLQHYGYEVSGSSMSGETCLKEIGELSLQGKEPEIVLMDIHLRGEINGIETARRINEKFNCAIIFLTGQSSKEVYERSFRIKPFGYLLKPIDMEQTKMTVEIASYQRNLEIENKRYQKDLEILLEQRSGEVDELMALYHAIIDNTVSGIIIIQGEKIVFFNPRIAEIFDYSMEEFLSLSLNFITDLYHPGDRDKMLSIYRDLLNGTGSLRQLPVRIFTRNKQEKQLEVVVKQILFKGKPALHQTCFDIANFSFTRT